MPFYPGSHTFDETASAPAVSVIPVSVQKGQALTAIHPWAVRTPPHEDRCFFPEHKQHPTLCFI